MGDHTGERNPIDCVLFGRNEISECIWFIQLPDKCYKECNAAGKYNGQKMPVCTVVKDSYG